MLSLLDIRSSLLILRSGSSRYHLMGLALAPRVMFDRVSYRRHPKGNLKCIYIEIVRRSFCSASGRQMFRFRALLGGGQDRQVEFRYRAGCPPDVGNVTVDFRIRAGSPACTGNWAFWGVGRNGPGTGTFAARRRNKVISALSRPRFHFDSVPHLGGFPARYRKSTVWRRALWAYAISGASTHCPYSIVIRSAIVRVVRR